MALNIIVVAKCVGCAQATRRLCIKKTRHRLVGRVAKCPQLRANCVNHQPLKPLIGVNILPMYLNKFIIVYLNNIIIYLISKEEYREYVK